MKINVRQAFFPLPFADLVKNPFNGPVSAAR